MLAAQAAYDLACATDLPVGCVGCLDEMGDRYVHVGAVHMRSADGLVITGSLVRAVINEDPDLLMRVIEVAAVRAIVAVRQQAIEEGMSPC